MSKEQTVVVQNSFPVAGILGILFVVLKLTGTINWSWWWVTSPFWIPPVAVIAIFIAVGVFAIIAFMLTLLFEK